MEDRLIIKLYNYLRRNNPDVLFRLQEGGTVTSYLQDKIDGVATLLQTLQAQRKPEYIIEETCMAAMTEDLRPSKFNYISAILEEEFETDHARLLENGTLTYEVINMLTACSPVFEAFGFTAENEDSRQLHYAVTGAVHEYLTGTSE